MVALVWAVLRAWPFRAEWSWAGPFVANFGAASFFVSYFTGQFVRIRRQQTTEQTHATLMDQLGGLTSTVGELTTKVEEIVARGPIPQPFANDILRLASNANTQLAQANSTAAGLTWQADTPLPLRPSGFNPAALERMYSSPPKPPDKPSATGTS